MTGESPVGACKRINLRIRPRNAYPQNGRSAAAAGRVRGLEIVVRLVPLRRETYRVASAPANSSAFPSPGAYR